MHEKKKKKSLQSFPCMLSLNTINTHTPTYTHISYEVNSTNVCPRPLAQVKRENILQREREKFTQREKASQQNQFSQ